MVGGAIGDAAGSSFEGTSGGSGRWALTDDTQLTLATFEALLCGKVDPAAIAESMLGWFRARRLSGLGSSTLKALRDLNAGGHWALVGRKGEFAAGNGAAMRIAPLAFCCDPLTPLGRQLIRDVSRITHHHEEAYAGALAVVMAIRGLDVGACLPDCVVRDRVRALAGVSSIGEAALLGTSGYVADTVGLALFGSSLLESIGFAGMLEQLIGCGGDTDTIASIAGQVAGARLGLSGLPSDLVERVPDLELVLSVASRFADGVL